MTASAIETYEQLCQHARTTALLGSIESLLGWDERTLLPPAAGEYRAEQMTYLAGMLHRRQTDPQLGEMLEALAGSELATADSSDAAVNIRELRRDYEKKVKLPQALVEELTRATVRGQQIWVEARKKNDFASFQPILEQIVALKRQQADALGYPHCRYDALLDDHEPGETTANVERVLSGLREELVPLVGAIRDCDRKPDLSILRRHYPIDAQQALGREAASLIGFDFQRGRLDVTAHPFCSELGPHDCRITTRYDDAFFPMAFFGILHEAGHGIYDQGLRTDQYGLPMGRFVSMGIHESQSRLWENLVGRSRPFWEHFYGAAQSAFPGALADVPLDDFHFAINDVRPSLIRVEADEVTYNLHIIIRFELEQALIEGDLAVADLPAAWHEKYREYLGIESTTDSDGVLQDIHWSAGLFGYFPTYSLGNLYAGQFFAKADAELGGLTEQFRRGEFAPLRAWLREKIHRQGQRHTAAHLAEVVTGQPLGHAELINYLLAKMEPLYDGTSPQPVPPSEYPERASAISEATIVTASAVVGAAVEVTSAASTSEAALVGEETNLSTVEPTQSLANEGPSVAQGTTEEPLVEEPAWPPAETEQSIDAGFDAATMIRTGPRQEAYEIGMVGNLVGVVVFGFFGLLIGYWLLNFFGGERFNFLDIWLPFVTRGP